MQIRTTCVTNTPFSGFICSKTVCTPNAHLWCNRRAYLYARVGPLSSAMAGVHSDNSTYVKLINKLSKYKDLNLKYKRFNVLKKKKHFCYCGCPWCQKHLVNILEEPCLEVIEKIMSSSTAHILRNILSFLGVCHVFHELTFLLLLSLPVPKL